ncbi:MAG: class I SAM-dependent methyltransferase [Actinomycetota bacterium]
MSAPRPEPPDADPLARLGDDVTDAGVFQAVLDGYDAVYDALPRSETFSRIWRASACGGDFPAEFAHISFLTLGEARRILRLLSIGEGDVLVDVACGAGGPGLWAAQQTGAALIGIDPSAAGLATARQRADSTGLAQRARFAEGTFERTGLGDRSADAVMSVDALQYAPGKRPALAELFRVLRPGGALVFIAFEVDPSKVTGLPVLGADPVRDYVPLLQGAGFAVEVCEETPGWPERVYGAFGAIIESAGAIEAEMGQHCTAGLVLEAMLTVQLRPYPRRVLVAARRHT